MQMQMENALAAVGTVIDDQPIPAPLDSQFPRQVPGRGQEDGPEVGILVGQGGYRGNVLTGNDEDMGGSLGMQIPEGHHLRRGAEDLGRGFPRRNAAEYTRPGHEGPLRAPVTTSHDRGRAPFRAMMEELQDEGNPQSRESGG